MSFAFRIAIAIVGYLITVILAYGGVWGDYFFIQFTLENYCTITASTLNEVEKHDQPSKMKSQLMKVEESTRSKDKTKASLTQA